MNRTHLVHFFRKHSRGMFMGPLWLPVLLISACSKPPATEPVASRTPVHVAAPVPGPAAAPVVTTGIITTASDQVLSFKTGGLIQKILVEEGQPVKQGQLLAELKPQEIDAAYMQASQMHDKAQRDLQRGQRLYQDQVISLEQLQNLETQANIAAAQLQAARFNQNSSRIVANSEGVVLRKLVQPNETVAPGQPVLALGVSSQGFKVKLGLSDRDVLQLKKDGRAEVTIDALSAITLQGRISVIGGAASTDNGLFPVEVVLAPANQALVAGMIANVSLYPDVADMSDRHLLYIPAGAVVSGEDRKAKVFVLDNDHASKRDIDVAFFTRDQVAVRHGLAVTDKVITDGTLYLKDGEKVSVQQD